MIEELMKCDLKITKNGIKNMISTINKESNISFIPRRSIEGLILCLIDKKLEGLTAQEYCAIQDLSMEIYLELKE